MKANKRLTQADRAERSTRKLLDAATQLIADQGFSRTSIPQIAEKAGYTQGLVSQRFGSKAGLIQTLARKFQVYFGIERLLPALDDRRGLDAVLTTLETYIDVVLTSDRLGRAYYELYGESITLVPEIHDIFVRADRDFRLFLKEMIDESVEQGEIPKEVDSWALAGLVLSILRGFAMQWVRDPTAVDWTAVKKEMRRLFERAYSLE